MTTSTRTSKRTTYATDDLPYEVVTLEKNGLYRRDGLRYKGIRCATRAAHNMRKIGIDCKVLPWREITEQLHIRDAVA